MHSYGRSIRLFASMLKQRTAQMTEHQPNAVALCCHSRPLDVSPLLLDRHHKGYSQGTPGCGPPCERTSRRSITVPCPSACRCSSRCLPPRSHQRTLTPVTITAARPAGSGPVSSRRPKTFIYGRRNLWRCVACQLGFGSGAAFVPVIGARSSLRCQRSGASLEASLPPRCVAGRHLGRPNHAPGGSACG